MTYCRNCGTKLREGANFCDHCGYPVLPQENSAQRQTVFEGSVHKCPQCGEILQAFVEKCPVCGYELRGSPVSNAIRNFSWQMQQAETVNEKAEIINSFPIPNTREDILEFFIMAVSSVHTLDFDSTLSKAWQSKIEQAYQKAKLLFEDGEELRGIEEKYEQIGHVLNKKRKTLRLRKAGYGIQELLPDLPNVLIAFFWCCSLFLLLSCCRSPSYEITPFMLVYLIDLAAGTLAAPFAFRCETALPKVITALGIFLNIAFTIPLCARRRGGSDADAFQFLLVVQIICSAVIFFKMLRNKGGEKTAVRLNGMSVWIAVFCVIAFVVLFEQESLFRPYGREKTETETEAAAKGDEYDPAFTYEIRNYVGKNAASIGRESGGYLVDDYGEGELRIVFVSEDGILLGKNEEIRKGYTVAAQNIPPKSEINIVHLTDSYGKPYSSLVDFQSFEEIVLYAAPIGDSSYQPAFTKPMPTLDRHAYHIRDYTGRNAASFGKMSGGSRVDEYGEGELRISFVSEDGAYIDPEDENDLKCYVVTGQEPEANTALNFVYQTDSRGREYDSLLQSQNYEEITLFVKRLEEEVIASMPKIGETETENLSERETGTESVSEDTEEEDLTVEYRVLQDGKAEITGFKGEGAWISIDSTIDGHEVVRIGEKAFLNCDTLETIVFWADVESVEDYAFAGCTSLESVSLPGSVKTIGAHAFEGCSNLRNAFLWGDPDIGEYAFADCTALDAINIGSDTRSVGAHAFDGCLSLESALIWGDDTVIGEDAFANCPLVDKDAVQEY